MSLNILDTQIRRKIESEIMHLFLLFGRKLVKEKNIFYSFFTCIHQYIVFLIILNFLYGKIILIYSFLV